MSASFCACVLRFQGSRDVSLWSHLSGRFWNSQAVMLYRYWKVARCAGFGANVSFADRKTDARESAAIGHAFRMRRIVEMIVLPPVASFGSGFDQCAGRVEFIVPCFGFLRCRGSLGGCGVWIPAYAGMTWECAGMTWEGAGMAWESVGMTGMGRCGAGWFVAENGCWMWPLDSRLRGNDVGGCGSDVGTRGFQASRARARGLGYARARVSVAFCRILSNFVDGELGHCRLGIARCSPWAVVWLEWPWA